MCNAGEGKWERTDANTDTGVMFVLFHQQMLQQYKQGIEDLNHLLKVDPKNTAAKKEMEVLKNYWRKVCLEENTADHNGVVWRFLCLCMTRSCL